MFGKNGSTHKGGGFSTQGGVYGNRNGARHNDTAGIFGNTPQHLLRREQFTGDTAYTMMGEKYFEGEINGAKKQKEKTKYPFHSDIQEIHDRMQILHIIGAGFVGQKTMDITDSQYITTIPLGMTSITAKMIGFVLVYFAMAFFLNFLSVFVFPKFSTNYVHFALMNIFFVFFCFSTFFYKFFVMSMQQYVIPDEKEARTQRFYAVIKSFWIFFEAFFYIIAFGSILLHFKRDVIIGKFQYVWVKMAKFLKLEVTMLNTHKIYEFIDSFILFTWSFAILYILFSLYFTRRFKKKQKQNYKNLLIQHDESKAVNLMMSGDL